jgi:hypothetical protein
MAGDPFKYNSIARFATEHYDSPLAKIARGYADSPMAKIARDYADSPMAKIARDYADSPMAKISRNYVDSPLAKIARDHASDPVAQFARGRLADTVTSNPSTLEKQIAQSLRVDRAFAAPTRQYARELATFNAELDLPTGLDFFRVGRSALQESMISARGDWLDLARPHQSVYAFDALSAIGAAAQAAVPFGEDSVRAVRAGLGDWRDISNIKPDVLLNAETRKKLYHEQGLAAGLSEFPSNAYPEILQLSGLFESSDRADGATVDQSNAPRPNTVDIGVLAFRLLRTFEMGFRVFLAHIMLTTCGTKWTKQRVSETIRSRWVERRASAIEDGEIERPLHDYADIFDYAEIIVRNDNWDDVFSAIFRNKDEVQVSFRRLNAARRPVAHGREVTNEDLLLIGAEIARLRNAIRRSGHQL